MDPVSPFPASEHPGGLAAPAGPASPAPPPSAAGAWEVPRALVIIVGLMLIASLVTYVVPGGKYERVDKKIMVGGVEETRKVVDPASFQVVPAQPQNPWNLVNAVMKGMKHHSAMDIIFFILLVGGAFGIIPETKAVDGALASLVRRLGTQERLLIPVTGTVFLLVGATFGMCEEKIHDMAMAVPPALRLGYDSITAFQFGDAFTNTIIPTSAVTMAALGMGGVPWERWARLILPLTIASYVLGALSLAPPVMVGWMG